MAIWRVLTSNGIRLATGAAESGPEILLRNELTLSGLLAADDPDLDTIERYATSDRLPSRPYHILSPVDEQEVWAAGVTYVVSWDGRREESVNPGPYQHVYHAPRPEIFFKSTPSRVRGPNEAIAIRADSTWDVPEPELGLVIDASGRIQGYVIGNDMSSRSIEGENPLYLPQAKIYTGSCAVGPCIVPVAEAPPLDEMVVRLWIERKGQPVVQDEIPVSSMNRTVEDLTAWLTKAMDFPCGVVLLTGTGIVPPKEFTLRSGDKVLISIDGLGTLLNTVKTVGRET